MELVHQPSKSTRVFTVHGMSSSLNVRFSECEVHRGAHVSSRRTTPISPTTLIECIPAAARRGVTVGGAALLRTGPLSCLRHFRDPADSVD